MNLRVLKGLKDTKSTPKRNSLLGRGSLSDLPRHERNIEDTIGGPESSIRGARSPCGYWSRLREGGIGSEIREAL